MRDTFDAPLLEVMRRRLAARIRAQTLPIPTASERKRLRKPRVVTGVIDAGIRATIRQP